MKEHCQVQIRFYREDEKNPGKLEESHFFDVGATFVYQPDNPGEAFESSLKSSLRALEEALKSPTYLQKLKMARSNLLPAGQIEMKGAAPEPRTKVIQGL